MLISDEDDDDKSTALAIPKKASTQAGNDDKGRGGKKTFTCIVCEKLYPVWDLDLASD